MSRPLMVADSSCDVNEEILERTGIRRVPFTLIANDHVYIDDETMDISVFLDDVAASEQVTGSAAMGPQAFMQAAGDAQEIFIFTITSHLSSTFNNAMLAATELREKGRKVHVFNTESASAGETSYMMRVQEMIEAGLSFEEIVAREEEIVRTNVTYFILDDYSTLIKSGRLPRLAGRILSTLSIRPVCRGVNGEIGIRTVARGMDNAIRKLAEAILSENMPFAERTLYITHIQAPERARQVCEMVEKLVSFGRVVILEGGGLNAAYANFGGIVIGF